MKPTPEMIEKAEAIFGECKCHVMYVTCGLHKWSEQVAQLLADELSASATASLEAMKGVRERALEQAATICHREARIRDRRGDIVGVVDDSHTALVCQTLADAILALKQPPAQKLVGQGLGEGGNG